MPGYVEHLLFDRAEWRVLIAAQAEKLMQYFLEGGGLRAAELAEQIGFVGAFDVTNPEVSAWITGYTFKFAEKIAATASDRMRDVMTDGLENGETIRQLRQRILDDAVIGPQADKYRAEMIARTESARAEQAGELQSWQNTNAQARRLDKPPVFVARIWRANSGSCDLCASMDGTQIGMEEAFFNQGDTLEVEGAGSMSFDYEAVNTTLLHPNCVCTSEVVLGEAYR